MYNSHIPWHFGEFFFFNVNQENWKLGHQKQNLGKNLRKGKKQKKEITVSVSLVLEVKFRFVHVPTEMSIPVLPFFILQTQWYLEFSWLIYGQRASMALNCRFVGKKNTQESTFFNIKMSFWIEIWGFCHVNSQKVIRKNLLKTMVQCIYRLILRTDFFWACTSSHMFERSFTKYQRK